MAPTSSPLPRGPHHLPRETVEASQRDRVLRGMVDSVAERTYAGASVADVIARAGVSRRTFYEHFANKEECFLAAYDRGWHQLSEVLTGAARTSQASSDDPVDWLRASLGAHLRFMADEPAFARSFFIEVLAAGPAALERRAEVHAAFASMTRAWHRRARSTSEAFHPVPDGTYRALVGAMHELVVDRVRGGRTSDLGDLEPTLLYVHLALLGDAATAAASTPEAT